MARWGIGASWLWLLNGVLATAGFGPIWVDERQKFHATRRRVTPPVTWTFDTGGGGCDGS